jgi:hypothetical protein
MHIYVIIYLLFVQYNPINQICTKKRKPINFHGFHNPKTPNYKHIYLFIYFIIFLIKNFGLYRSLLSALTFADSFLNFTYFLIMLPEVAVLNWSPMHT